MTTTAKRTQQAAAVTLLSTELNSLGSGSFATLGGVIDNDQGQTNLDGYLSALLELNLAAYTGTPSAGAAAYVYFLRSKDGGTTYELADSTISRAPDAIIALYTKASGPQNPQAVTDRFPVGKFKTYLKAVGTGITFASSGNTLTATLDSVQSV